MNPTLRFAQNVVFLALVLWREARGEPRIGKVAIAFSILNRVQRPSWWGRTVMSVITKRWQYSSMTAPGDPNLVLWPSEDDYSWEECLEVARSALDGSATNPAPGADSYYAVSMKTPPKWADPKRFVIQIGGHRFYDLDADYERSDA